MGDRLVLRGGEVAIELLGAPARAVGVEDGRIAFIGTDDQAEGWIGTGSDAPTVVDLHGALLTPAFVDSHVHTVRTGFALTGLDLTGLPSLAVMLDALASFAADHPDDGVVVGQGWDETDWPRRGRPRQTSWSGQRPVGAST